MTYHQRDFRWRWYRDLALLALETATLLTRIMEQPTTMYKPTKKASSRPNSL